LVQNLVVTRERDSDIFQENFCSAQIYILGRYYRFLSADETGLNRDTTVYKSTLLKADFPECNLRFSRNLLDRPKDTRACELISSTSIRDGVVTFEFDNTVKIEEYLRFEDFNGFLEPIDGFIFPGSLSRSPYRVEFVEISDDIIPTIIRIGDTNSSVVVNIKADDVALEIPGGVTTYSCLPDQGQSYNVSAILRDIRTDETIDRIDLSLSF
jgi:hypothetical protein